MNSFEGGGRKDLGPRAEKSQQSMSVEKSSPSRRAGVEGGR